MALSISATGMDDLGEATMVPDEPVLVRLDADTSTRDQWAEARARGGSWLARARRGKADGTGRALRLAKSLTFVCSKQHCHALVSKQAASRRARAAGRTFYLQGDGCASRQCSGNFQRGQFIANQRKMAFELRTHKRHLLAWPAQVHARAAWLLSLSDAHAAADAALSATENASGQTATRSAARVTTLEANVDTVGLHMLPNIGKVLEARIVARIVH